MASVLLENPDPIDDPVEVKYIAEALSAGVKEVIIGLKNLGYKGAMGRSRIPAVYADVFVSLVSGDLKVEPDDGL